MSDYLKIIYDEGIRPYTEYRDKLISYLFKASEIKKGMTLLEPSYSRGHHLHLFKASCLNVYDLILSMAPVITTKPLLRYSRELMLVGDWAKAH